MSEHTQCVVLLPPGSHFTRLFDEILSPTLIEAGLAASLLQRSPPSPIPSSHLHDQIEQASLFLADLSADSTEIWFALGYALALRKATCLLSSKRENSSPLAIEQLSILFYPANPFPSDYLALQRSLSTHLARSLPGVTEAQQIERPTPAPNDPLPAASEPYSVIASQPQPSQPDDLVSYEVLALTIIDSKATARGLSPRDLGLEMRDNELAHLTSHAINALKRRGFLERRSTSLTAGTESFISDNLFLTPLGEQWLIRSGKRTPLFPPNVSSSNTIKSL